MSRITDFHTHILPEIDDGSASLNESIEMLKMQAAQGIRRVVATPHFYAQHDTPHAFLERRMNAEKLLRQEMAKHGGMPELHIGAEVYYFRGISHSDILSELTIDQKKCILIEMPLPPWSEQMYRELEAIQERRGITPIIAHIDRYIAPLHTFRIPERLAALPVLVQANAGFFLRKSTRNMALRMLNRDQIHLIGSDCHNTSDRAPNMGEAVDIIEHRYGQSALEQIAAHECWVFDAS